MQLCLMNLPFGKQGGEIMCCKCILESHEKKEWTQHEYGQRDLSRNCSDATRL
jgi:hypothetical protein